MPITGGAVTFDLSSVLKMVPDGPDTQPSKFRSMMIAGVDDQGIEVLPTRSFQWNPATLSFSAEIGWQPKEVAGGSHAILQWSSNQGHTLNFEVMLSRSIHPPVNDYEERIQQGEGFDQYNVDIMQEINFLRSFYHPHYGDIGGLRVAEPPVTAWIYLPNIEFAPVSTAPGDLAQDKTLQNVFRGVMTQCDWEIMKAFPNGTPRLAKVALAFRDVVQDRDGVHWVDRDEIMALAGLTPGRQSFKPAKAFNTFKP